MSWSYNKVGRASKLAAVVQQQFKDVGGCPRGTAEEDTKIALGLVCENLCNGFKGDPVVHIEACGSAWTEGTKALSQSVVFKFTTLGDFVD